MVRVAVEEDSDITGLLYFHITYGILTGPEGVLVQPQCIGLDFKRSIALF